MRKLLLLLSLCAAIAYSQDVTGVAVAEQLAITANSVVATVTASQGDGTVCSWSKLPGLTIGLALKCTSVDGKVSYSSTFRSTSSVNTLLFGYGSVICTIAINPTSTAITMGSIGSVPATGAAWACTTLTSSSGETTPTNGSVSWP